MNSLSYTFTTKGSHVASLVIIPPCGFGGDSVTDRWMHTRWKNNVVLAHSYHEGRSCRKSS